MKTIPLSALQEISPDVVSSIKNGEQIAVMENGSQCAKIVPTGKLRRNERRIGLAKGDFVVPDDFNNPLPEDVLRDFEGQ